VEPGPGSAAGTTIRRQVMSFIAAVGINRIERAGVVRPGSRARQIQENLTLRIS